MVDAELESFKIAIDLRAYAASEGYALLRKESWASSAVMRHADGDKIIIKKDADGHWIYFSVHRDDDKGGTIIDFVAHRKRLSLGTVRKELRPWINKQVREYPPYPPLQTAPKDRSRVELEFARMSDADRHPYLENERGIPSDLLVSERFSGRVRLDDRGNAVFPHFDQSGLCGFEKKNSAFTGFSSGGTKGLWLSHAQPDDGRIVFCESAIDALSHAALFPDAQARYASVGGKLNPAQPELIRAAIARMPADAEIVAAMDADQAGNELAEIVRRAVELSGRGDVQFRIQQPMGVKDWNDQLRTRPRTFPSFSPEVPSVV